MHKFVGTIGLILCAVGCSDSGHATIAEKPHGDWTALADLQDQALMGIGMPADMGDWQTVRQVASSGAFAQAVDNFEKSELPPELKGEEAQKAEVVKNLRDLIAAAKGGGNVEQMKTAWTNTQTTIASMKDKQMGTKK